MRNKKGQIQISASDLSNYLSCRHLTELDLLAAHERLKAPPFNNPHADAIQERGFQHENAYIEHLENSGLSVRRLQVDAEKANLQTGLDLTLTAMREGHDVIVQATLKLENYFGRADILLKVPTPSALGEFSYEIVDTKLAMETKASSLLQLCLYSEMLASMQDFYPERMGVVTPGSNFVPEYYRLDEFNAYYRLIKSSLLLAIGDYDQKQFLDPNAAPHYPEPRAHCDVCKWFEICNDRRRKDDHLSFVASLSTSQQKELEEMGIKTLKDLAVTELDLKSESLAKAHEQARMQLDARVTGKPKFERLKPLTEKGLNRLPEPSPGDVFFDLEGDSFFGSSGLEYLWGCVYFDLNQLTYRSQWSFDFKEEKKAFEDFIDFIIERKKTYPELKIYHYAPYEPAALKRLMGRYGVREAEIDQLLREETFVDLYSISRQSIRAGIEKYSIKDLEQFYGFTREMNLRDLGPHKRLVEHSLELDTSRDIPKKSLDAVELYNKDDCASTFHLRQWLEELRAEAISQGEVLSRPPLVTGEVREELSQKLQEMGELRSALQKDLNAVPEERSSAEQGQWILSELISFYRREDKVNYFEKFRLQELDSLELLEDKSGISGLTLEGVMGGTAKCPVERYRFLPQEIDIKSGSDLYLEGGHGERKAFKVGTIETLDLENGILDVKKTQAAKDINLHALWAWGIVKTDNKAERVLELGKYVLEEGMENSSLSYKAAREILTRQRPDLSSSVPSAASPLERAKAMALRLNHSYLAIQGPPGTGKSYTASRVILSLLEKRYKVGVTALSHKVISNLLHKTLEASEKEHVQAKIYQKNEDRENPKIEYLKSSQEVDAKLASETGIVIGGTDFLWATISREALDYLIIDEAGQFSLTGLLAIAHCTKNIILLGDGAQLTQPIKGSHPEGCEVSALDHIVGNANTLPDEKGVFLGTTYRLHPNICSFNSELFYENRLRAVEGNEAQVISGVTRFAGVSLALEEVFHTRNSNTSKEEVEKIKDIVTELVLAENTFTIFKDGKNITKKITPEDIKIVAPYNAQVNLLKKALPNLSIGTVDKFQGQEAPIVIYSVTTSTPEEAPRGMDFLYSGNRLNVAVSRAECLFIMVCSPAIFEVDCKSPKQMKLANAYARFKELTQKK